jgi:hypothetical protein
MAHACHPSYTGSLNRRIIAQTSLGIKQDRISKITSAKADGGVSHMTANIKS